MNVRHEYPPNIAQIAEVFPHVRAMKGVLFTFGGTVYIPDGSQLTPELFAHESVHYERQTDDIRKIDAWWEGYLHDPAFRVAEELPAHRAEYRAYCVNHRDRNQRAQRLHRIAQRMSGPLYNNMIPFLKARAEIAK